jgi:ectoine hydroxylase-related dioxygenase (phytanoyl-CoA dioxygenase family)
VLPSLDEPCRLPDVAPAEFARDGFVLVRGLASADEIAAFRPAIVETAARLRWDLRRLEERDTYGQAFLQTFNLWRHDETVKRFVFARRFARAAAELLGVSAVRLYHDQALFKEAGGGPTPWHQDQHYWPLDTDRTITLWMPLHDLTPETGIMHFARGSHTRGCLFDLPIGDESEALLSRLIADQGFEVVGAGATHAGDASFHAGWTLHGAPPNRTSTVREVMTVIYFADGTRVAEPDSPGRRFDLKTWLPGVAPGELAASPINPILHPDGPPGPVAVD